VAELEWVPVGSEPRDDLIAHPCRRPHPIVVSRDQKNRTVDVDPALRRWLERQAADVLARLPADGDVRDEVRSVLSNLLTVGDFKRWYRTTPQRFRLAAQPASGFT
jgi:hypothetical protein